MACILHILACLHSHKYIKHAHVMFCLWLVNSMIALSLKSSARMCDVGIQYKKATIPTCNYVIMMLFSLACNNINTERGIDTRSL